ncbi:DUF3795 domain-containing protein [Xanthomarina sp.]|jgi:hypothetical protein|uniref:DUF3795 domain-containing protein n=1 Tax=Xanthomarina sp. TaxID=1931211 RepID=UPI002BE93887|nr:DUF3795 domain-containing protein [Xanthomarina sp.]HLV39955.1 DUF3795 domain-containing protein [Xanthomarina sp.]
MNREAIISSIAYCGLVCKLCHLANECDGCKATGCNCSANSEKEKGCYHRNCCIDKVISGCWECEDFPCANSMFIGRTSGEIKGFCRCLKDDGVDKFIDYILKNQERGIPYGLKGYGQMTEEEVVQTLRQSK